MWARAPYAVAIAAGVVGACVRAEVDVDGYANGE